MPLVSYLKRKSQTKTQTLSEKKLPVAVTYCNSEIHVTRVFVLLVDIVLDWQQVIAHSLEGKLVQDRRHGVKCPVQDDQL